MNETVSRTEFEELRRRVDKAEERLYSGDTTLALLKQRLDQIESKLDELGAAIQDLKMKPARKWESVSQTVLTWVVTALLAFIAIKMGLK